MNEDQNHVPALILPKEMAPTLGQVVADLKTDLRRRRLVAVGIEREAGDLTDRDVDRLVAAEQKRQRRRARNRRVLYGGVIQ